MSDEKKAMTVEELKDYFVLRGIRLLRGEGRLGINPQTSGLNGAFKKQFGEDPVNWTNGMADRGLIVVQPFRSKKGFGGVILYTREDAEAANKKNPDTIIKKLMEGVG
jgi:hypothetical protein